MRLLVILATAIVVSGCATTNGNPSDPWEPLNRKTHALNETFDRAIAKPVALGYQKITPAFAQEGVNNFYSNFEDIGTSLNNLLQGKLKESASDAGRVVVNTLFGVLGLWDVATPLGLEKHDEDFGQTLGWWGMPSGPYFVIPFLGPSTARDAPARFVDPQWYVGYRLDEVGRSSLYWSLWGLDKVRTRANVLKAEKVLDEAALDKYSFIRDAWLQRRQNQVYDGNPPREKDEFK